MAEKTPEPTPNEISAEEMLLNQAVENIEAGNLADARDVLTRLLKDDQQNVTYWVWLSAAMETQKERLYCLQTAYKLDPNNAAAKRGLILLGALPPQDDHPPFPMNHPRPWENKVRMTDDKPKPTGLKALTGNPIFRVAAWFVIGGMLIGSVAVVFAINPDLGRPPTKRVVTASVTPTQPTATPDFVKHGPMADLNLATSTATAIYAATPHEGAAADAFKGAMLAYRNKQWELMIDLMAQVATQEPGAVDAVYFIAEGYRLGEKYDEALDTYREAAQINPSYAPIYLGIARASLGQNPRKDVIKDLDKAIELDGNFGEAYLERAFYLTSKGREEDALADLRQAIVLMPDSPLAYLSLARLELRLENNKEALEAAQTANELDKTYLESYLVLGMTYRANGMIDEALEMLETYTKYSKTSSEAFAFLGATYFNRGEIDKATKSLDQAILLDKTSSEAYYWRGETYMALKDYEKAEEAFRNALRYNAIFFDAGIGIARSFEAREDYQRAYGAVLNIQKIVRTDTQKARYLYHEAINLDKIGYPDTAYKSFVALLALPEEIVDPIMWEEANTYVRKMATLTPSLTPGRRTNTPTSTPTSTNTPSRTPTRTPTPTPKPATPTP